MIEDGGGKEKSVQMYKNKITNLKKKERKKRKELFVLFLSIVEKINVRRDRTK
jgi:hypothetical protein